MQGGRWGRGVSPDKRKYLHPIAQSKVPFSGRLNVEGKVQGPGGRGHGGRDAATA